MAKNKIVKATREHIDYVIKNLRQADVDEIHAAGRDNIEEVFENVEGKVWAAIDKAGTPFLLFGVSPGVDHDGFSFGIPWLVGTKEMDRNWRFVLQNTKSCIATMRKGVNYLLNMVCAENKQSIKWLCWAGFEIGGVIKCRKDFRIFYMEGEL